jgi:hypothetical protein
MWRLWFQQASPKEFRSQIASIPKKKSVISYISFDETFRIPEITEDFVAKKKSSSLFLLLVLALTLCFRLLFFFLPSRLRVGRFFLLAF